MRCCSGTGNVLHTEERFKRDLFSDLVEGSDDGYWYAELNPKMGINLSTNDQVEHLLTRSSLLYCNREFARACNQAEAGNLFDKSFFSLVLYFSALPYQLFQALPESQYSLLDARFREVDSNGTVAWYSHTSRGIVEGGYLHRLWGRKRRISPSEWDEGATASLLRTLNERQKTILQLSARGLTLKEIGDTISLNPKTVATIRLRLLRKHGYNNVVAFVTRAYPMFAGERCAESLCEDQRRGTPVARSRGLSREEISSSIEESYSLTSAGS